MPGTEYHMEPLVDEEAQRLVRQAVRGLPRVLQTAWPQALAAAGNVASMPGWFLLATTCAAATVERPDVPSLSTLVHADTAALVNQLVEDIRQRYPAQASL